MSKLDLLDKSVTSLNITECVEYLEYLFESEFFEKHIPALNHFCDIVDYLLRTYPSQRNKLSVRGELTHKVFGYHNKYLINQNVPETYKVGVLEGDSNKIQLSCGYLRSIVNLLHPVLRNTGGSGFIKRVSDPSIRPKFSIEFEDSTPLEVIWGVDGGPTSISHAPIRDLNWIQVQGRPQILSWRASEDIFWEDKEHE